MKATNTQNLRTARTLSNSGIIARVTGNTIKLITGTYDVEELEFIFDGYTIIDLQA
jgi:high-affinity nickel permease